MAIWHRLTLRSIGIVALVMSTQGCSVLSGLKEKADPDIARLERIDMLVQRAETAYRAKQFKKSADIWKQVTMLDPVHVKALYRLGNTQFRLGNMKVARGYYEKTVEASPRHAKAHYNLAVISLVIAEQHLQFYAATTDPGADLESVTAILGEIDKFKDAQNKTKPTRLEQLAKKLSEKNR
ncbi:hypothetical protein A9Q99_04405 [Gammaproteobacteria bacterium 45_16_T64]|nr:hypothetical protein A9Q99_04405 [Gammaproteobacteria bacterium 45_16_T64]